jgi:hypothetical protein
MQIKIDRKGIAKIQLTKQERETLLRAEKLCDRIARNEDHGCGQAAVDSSVGLKALIDSLEVSQDTDAVKE